MDLDDLVIREDLTASVLGGLEEDALEVTPVDDAQGRSVCFLDLRHQLGSAELFVGGISPT